jgi:hypothetical protein
VKPSWKADERCHDQAALSEFQSTNIIKLKAVGFQRDLGALQLSEN